MKDMAPDQERPLVLALQECLRALRNPQRKPTDASSMRDLQEDLQLILEMKNPSHDRLRAFWLNGIIDDIFYNLFGDTPYSRATEQARQEICDDFTNFLEVLLVTSKSEVSNKQLSCWEDFVNRYLDKINQINRSTGGGDDELRAEP